MDRSAIPKNHPYANISIANMIEYSPYGVNHSNPLGISKAGAKRTMVKCTQRLILVAAENKITKIREIKLKTLLSFVVNKYMADQSGISPMGPISINTLAATSSGLLYSVIGVEEATMTARMTRYAMPPNILNNDALNPIQYFKL